jgi:two-component system, response regulator
MHMNRLKPESRHILLVEDDPDDLALTLRAFQQAGVPARIAVAKDGAQALDYLLCRGEHATRDPRDPPGLVLLDLKLPGMDGLDVLKIVRATPRTRTVPVVILTTSREEEHAVAGFSSGASSFIRKPVDFDAFTRVIGELGAYWLTINEPPPTTALRHP